eukprot:CAMPEP_0115107534 /NCGR_PEP_ID=MMETSP0227-20121206/37376_1 /TAXON_ID=89957 /ORGANISM="Polarella glacialis, Strain CCMP 1383" /LENGTH=398 /DNA_ID=CAMNT_0002505477 /DNA_START=81 /DNA_END=1273 /DNA_ORIENTATION=-
MAGTAARQQMQEFEANDYYACLNLELGATEADVKRNFRKLALKWHPDKHQEGPPREKATEIFQKISQANEVLSDETSRTRYNTVWQLKHQRCRVVPEYAKNVEGLVRSGSVEGNLLRRGSLDRTGSVGPTAAHRSSTQSAPGSTATGRRFSAPEPTFPKPPQPTSPAANKPEPSSSTFNSSNFNARPSPQPPPSRPQQAFHPEDSGNPRERFGSTLQTGPSNPADPDRKPVGTSLRDSRRAAAHAEASKAEREREAESAARETELKKQEKALRKQEKERAESQSAWLKQKGQQNKAAARQGGRPDVDENGESWQNFMEQQDSRKAERERLEQEMDHHEELREQLNKERAAAGGVSPEIASPGRITGPGGACSFAPEARSFDGEGLTIRQQLQQAAAQQ